MHQEDTNKINKYLKGTASVDEQAKVEKLLSSGEDVNQVKEFIKNDWNEYIDSDQTEEKDLTGVLDRVHHAIQLKESKVRVSLQRKIYHWYSVAAAIIFIPLLVAGVISLFELKNANKLLSEQESAVSIISPSGGRLAFQLPDGTKGVLNGGSTLKYSIPFSNKRDVKLVGEAYFEVTHDKQHPFNVNTNMCDVEVLGTCFNVNAFPGNEMTEVILEKGKVACKFPDKKAQIVLSPDERIVISGDKIEKTKVDASNYTAWRNGKLIFHGEYMQEVAQRISRWYNVDVEIVDPELSAYSFRATFVDDSLEEVLELLKLTSPIDYKIKPREKLSDDSFSKKKVIIFKR